MTLLTQTLMALNLIVEKVEKYIAQLLVLINTKTRLSKSDLYNTLCS